MYILDELGYQGPLILNIVVALQLYDHWAFFVFILGFWLNKWLNEFLKSVFRAPRPMTVDLSVAKYRDPLWWIWYYSGNDNNHISPVHRWGMPSGHAQSAAFAIAFFYFIKEKKIRLFETFTRLTLEFSGMLVLFFITLCQRWVTSSHSFIQLVVGSLIGALFAGIIVFCAKWFMVENTKKPIKNI